MSDLSGCPRCGQGLAGEAVCPRCGVVFAKLRPRDPAEAARESGQPTPPSRTPDPRAPVPWGLVVGFAALLLAGAVGLPRLRSRPAADAAANAAPVPERVRVAADEEGLPPPPLPALPAIAPEPLDLPAPAAGSAADDPRIADLTRRVQERSPIGAAEIRAAEELLSQRPGDPGLRRLASAVLMVAGEQEARRRRFTEAMSLLDRATAVDPGNTAPWLALTEAALDANDWSRAEQAARGALALDAGLFDAWQRLGYALMRQDRNPEAVEALRTALGIRSDQATQMLLDRLMRGMANEKGMTQQQLSHFHVRYDGGEHETVGREILRALERHYATLASALDHQPEATIPVILYTRAGYYNANGAPAWSGGNYDGTDGRIRIPIGGLDAGLTPDMDSTLLHELTHAFVTDRTRGVAPKDVHEGLAQYMEGKRITSVLNESEMQLLADGRIQGVHGFYFNALSFVEYLIAFRGMGGMNEMLKVMGETGDVDEAFKQVHGQPHRAVQQAWRQRLRQQHGS